MNVFVPTQLLKQTQLEIPSTSEIDDNSKDFSNGHILFKILSHLEQAMMQNILHLLVLDFPPISISDIFSNIFLIFLD